MGQTTRKAKEPDDFEGNPEDVSAWCRRMTMYFWSNGIRNEWERIEIALGKIRKGKDNRAQRWADTQIRKFLPFQEEWKNSNLDEGMELDAETMKNKFPFNSWNEMTKEMGEFFISTETQTHAIERIHRLRQGSRMVEDYWSEFCTWKDLTGYNEVALVGIFKRGLHSGLARKLVELGQMKNSDSLNRWYESALDYERARREATTEFGGQGEKNNRRDQAETAREEKGALVVPRRDPEAMDIDRMKRQGVCFSCGTKGHIAARCPEPRKERKHFRRRVGLEKGVDEMREFIRSQMEDFGKGRE